MRVASSKEDVTHKQCAYHHICVRLIFGTCLEQNELR